MAAEDDFGEDASGGPDVDGGSVFGGSEEEFGGSVPEGDDLVGEFSFVGGVFVCKVMRVPSRGTCTAPKSTSTTATQTVPPPNIPRQTKIRQLDSAPPIHQNITALDVSVNVSPPMHEIQDIQKLLEETLDLNGSEFVGHVE